MNIFVNYKYLIVYCLLVLEEIWNSGQYTRDVAQRNSHLKNTSQTIPLETKDKTFWLNKVNYCFREIDKIAKHDQKCLSVVGVEIESGQDLW